MKKNSFKYQIFLKLSYYDYLIIDKLIMSITSILNLHFNSNAVSISKINFPLRYKMLTVLKSPHVYKKSREQFRQSIYTFGLVIKVDTLDNFNFIYYFLNTILKKTNCKFNLKSKINYAKK